MDRRNFLGLGGSALLTSGVGGTEAKAQGLAVAGRHVKTAKPNILMLMADQFRMDCARWERAAVSAGGRSA